MDAVGFESARRLGAVVRTERVRQGLSQADLALRAGVDRLWLGKLETGRLDNPTLRKVLQVVESLGLSLQVGGRRQTGSHIDLDDLFGPEIDGDSR